MALPMVSMEARAAADPELRFSPSGIAVATLRVVSSSRKRLDDGSWVDDKTCWLTVTAFKQLAENLAESAAKGDLQTITGKLQTDEWVDSNTQEKRSRTEVIADSVAVSLAFRQVRHGEGRSERATASAGADQWSTGGSSTDEPPF